MESSDDEDSLYMNPFEESDSGKFASLWNSFDLTSCSFAHEQRVSQLCLYNC